MDASELPYTAIVLTALVVPVYDLALAAALAPLWCNILHSEATGTERVQLFLCELHLQPRWT